MTPGNKIEPPTTRPCSSKLEVTWGSTPGDAGGNPSLRAPGLTRQTQENKVRKIKTTTNAGCFSSAPSSDLRMLLFR